MTVARRTAAQVLVDSLIANGVRRVFCVPGESYLAVLDALADVGDQIQVVVCRHEAGAANMAEAEGKLTGRPGVCFVTRGPGATHASIGVHTARQDSSPMILFIGQVARADRAREAFQEIEYRHFFGSIAKWVDEIDVAERVPEFVHRAFATALAGRMGPVVLSLPEDMLTETVDAAPRPVGALAQLGVDDAAIRATAARLAAAQKPVLILGGSDWRDRRLPQQYAEKIGAPTILSFRRKDLINNDSAVFAGDLGLGPNPKLIARIKQADLVVAIGARLGENPSQAYTLFTPTETAARLIHFHPDPEELNRVWPATLAAVANSESVLAALADALGAQRNADWADWRAQARADYEAWTKPVAVTGAVNMSEVVAHLNDVLATDAIITNGAGNYAAWLHRFIKHRAGGRQLAPTSGAMGYGVPAAIAAKVAEPSRTVVCFAGDGCFMMSAQELATAAQYQAGVIFIVVDNGSYGTIRMHQEKHYPSRVSATDLSNPDFAAFARAFGLWATTVETTAGFAPAFAEAQASGGPALIHVKTNVEDISPGRTLSAVRAGG
jgi:acetolactate synthase I/II/III large subunit